MTTLLLSPPLRTLWPPLPLPGAQPAVSPTLARTLLLAALLHVWLVLLLGNAPGGTALPGQGVWGAINVTLRGPAPPGANDVAPPPRPSGPAGAAELPRWGGAVRDAAPAVPQAPGAARLGEWAATVPQGVVATTPPAAAAALPAAPAPAATTPPVLPVPPEPAPAPMALARLASPEAAAAPAPALPTTPAAAAVALPVVPTLAPPPLPLPQAVPPAAERTLVSPLAATPGALRASPPLRPPEPAAAPLAWPAAPAALAEPLAAVPAPRPPQVLAPVPAAATAAVPALAPAPAPAAASTLAPVATPTTLPESTLPRLAPPLSAPAAAVTPVQPLERLPPVLSAPVPLPQASPALGPTPPLPLASGAAGTPDAGSQVGRDVATPPAATASTPPRLNLQLARPRGGELSRFSAPGVLPLLPRPPELPDKLAEDIARSAKKDCRSAYPGAGLLAVVPLAADALKKDSGCKW